MLLQPLLCVYTQGVQLQIVVRDRDDGNDTDDFVDSFAIDIPSTTTLGVTVNQSRNGEFGFAEIALTIRILCAENYDGDRCENFNDCLANQVTCSNHGTCIDGNESYTCDCDTCYIGPDCGVIETNSDECKGQPRSCSRKWAVCI